MNLNQRSAGVPLHVTSLPGPHGIGDFGPDAYRFADWLVSAGQRLWQLLPLNLRTTVDPMRTSGKPALALV